MDKTAAFEAGVADGIEKTAISGKLMQNVIRRGTHSPARLRRFTDRIESSSHKINPDTIKSQAQRRRMHSARSSARETAAKARMDRTAYKGDQAKLKKKLLGG